MSNPRFTPITSDLLARKGDAMPSTLSGKPSIFWRRPPLAEPLRPALEPVRDLRRTPPEPSRETRAPETMRETRAPETMRETRAPEIVRETRAHETLHDLRLAPEPVLELHHEIEPLPAGVVPPMVPPDGPRPHKMMVTLSHSDYEKLGIAAVKKGISRQQMLRVAVDLHIDRLKREFGGCGCMAMGGTGQCGEGCGAA